MMSPIQHESSIVLPSIHEMFPEYLMRDPGRARTTGHSSQRPAMLPSLAHGSHYRTAGPSTSSVRRHSTASDSVSPRARAPYSPHTSVAPGKSLRPSSPIHHLATRHDHSGSNAYAHPRRGQSGSPVFSFDVLRSDPTSSSLEHIASSVTFPNRGGSSAGYSLQCEISNGSAPVFRVSVPDSSRRDGNSRPHRSNSNPAGGARKSEPASAHAPASTGPGYSAMISFPVSGQTAGAQVGRDRSPDDPDAVSDGDLSGSNNGKKHVCPTCAKRFNRPSSLRIHVNTHTGATPFRCPWPNCAREFNVNSNMRRHYRNHTTPGFSRPQSNDARRRRKRGPPRGLVSIAGELRHEVQSASASMTPPISSLSMNEDSDEASEASEEDELDSLPDEASPTFESSPRPYSRSSDMSDRVAYDQRTSLSQFSQSNLRSGSHAFSSYPNSPSSSTPSPLEDHIYTPSAPYSRSFADSKVSTALRPAFHPKPVTKSRLIKEESMSDR
ncbi:hypothetical protein FPV67DRAFT_381242 [Lyophyllum atratum]|nr:hypothetical protein FPV67DRAFT_381242 [Lyophyllum atratum]